MIPGVSHRSADDELAPRGGAAAVLHRRRVRPRCASGGPTRRGLGGVGGDSRGGGGVEVGRGKFIFLQDFGFGFGSGWIIERVSDLLQVRSTPSGCTGRSDAAWTRGWGGRRRPRAAACEAGDSIRRRPRVHVSCCVCAC